MVIQVACDDVKLVAATPGNRFGLAKHSTYRYICCMLQNSKQFNLNPSFHTGSVKQFFEHFKFKKKLPTLDFLREILFFYAQLPYENISKIVKLQKDYTAPTRIRLPEEVMHDFAAYHLGGTCFSLTYFLQTILMDCGFLCYPFIAHMSRMKNAHCGLIVMHDNHKYVVDPGYLLNQPMQLHKDVRRLYRSPHTGVELKFNPQDEHFNLFTFDQNQKKFRYKFQDRALSADEFLNFWWDSFYWDGMKGICLTQVQEQGMIYVHNDYMLVQNLQAKQKGKVANVERRIQEFFQISPEWVERARAAIPDLVKLGQQHGYYRRIDK